MNSKQAPADSFCPSLPLFLLARSGRPLVWNHDGAKAVIGYSSGPLAVAASSLLQKRGLGQIRAISVSTAERFQEVIAQLALHGVRSMIWNYAGDASPQEVVQLRQSSGDNPLD